jgi:hypothetical protein
MEMAQHEVGDAPSLQCGGPLDQPLLLGGDARLKARRSGVPELGFGCRIRHGRARCRDVRPMASQFKPRPPTPRRPPGYAGARRWLNRPRTADAYLVPV